MPKKIPPLIDPKHFFNRARIMREFQLKGYLDVEITDILKLDKLKIPDFISEYAAAVDCDVTEMINIILRDWVIRLNDGESAYRKGILNRIVKAPSDVIEDKVKNRLLVHIHSEIPELLLKRKTKKR